MTNVNRWLSCVPVVCLSAVVLPAAGQTPTEGVACREPRTADGFPNIFGVWRNDTLTPLEPPSRLGEQEFYAKEEIAEIEQRNRASLARDNARGGAANDAWWCGSRIQPVLE